MSEGNDLHQYFEIEAWHGFNINNGERGAVVLCGGVA